MPAALTVLPHRAWSQMGSAGHVWSCSERRLAEPASPDDHPHITLRDNEASSRSRTLDRGSEGRARERSGRRGSQACM
jgi:hypothetical protein